MKIGYLSFRSEDQSREARRAALRGMECDLVVEQEVGYENGYKEAMQQLIESLSPGDTFVVWSLNSLGVKSKDIIYILDDFEARGIRLVSVRDQLDTTEDNSLGRFCRMLIAVDVNFHRTMTREGIKVAGERGTSVGRPNSIGKDEIIAIEAMLDAKVPKRRIAKHLSLSRSTLDRFLKSTFKDAQTK